MSANPGSLAAQAPQYADTFQARQLRDAQRALTEQAAARTAQSTQISSGSTVTSSSGAATAFGYNGGSTSFGTVPTTTAAFVWSMSVAVPAGFTTAIVQNVAQATGVNHSAGADYLKVAASINGVYGAFSLSGKTAAGDTASATASATRILTGLSGGYLTVDVLVLSAGASTWGSDATNQATVNAIVVFSQ